MTSIQDAWGVRTLDDRSDTTIPSRCNNAPQQKRAMIVQRPQPSPEPVPPQAAVLHQTVPYQTPSVRYLQTPVVTDDSELVGLLTMLLIFILIDKLFTIWNKS